MNVLRKLVKEYSVPLILGIIAALIVANYNFDLYHHLLNIEVIQGITVHFLINDVFMVFFFAIAAVEVVKSILPGGDLNPFKKAITPLFATVGGVLVPIAIFFLLNALFGSPDYSHGWGITTATDIAISWLVARSIFGKDHPAVKFLLLLAIADDAIGLVIIAIFYQESANIEPIWLGLVVVAMILAFFFRRLQIHTLWPYIMVCGGLSWLGLHYTGVHPALALVFIVPFLPFDKEMDCALHSFEKEWGGFVDLGLFFFGFANAGIQFSEGNALTLIIFLSLLLGKCLGIFSFTMLAKKIGFHLPKEIGKKEVFIISIISGIGLTVALFIASVAFLGNGPLTDAAKMGALASAMIALIAIVLAKMFKIKKIK